MTAPTKSGSLYSNITGYGSSVAVTFSTTGTDKQVFLAFLQVYNDTVTSVTSANLTWQLLATHNVALGGVGHRVSIYTARAATALTDEVVTCAISGTTGIGAYVQAYADCLDYAGLVLNTDYGGGGSGQDGETSQTVSVNITTIEADSVIFGAFVGYNNGTPMITAAIANNTIDYSSEAELASVAILHRSDEPLAVGSYSVGLTHNVSDNWRGGAVIAVEVLAAGPAFTAAGTGTATGGITEAAMAASDKYVDVTLTGTTIVPASVASATPLIEVADTVASGNNTASTSWAVTRMTADVGDLIIIILGWDDSTTVTGATPANGPNGETWTQIGSVVASASTEVRGTAYYTKATGTWGAGTIVFTPTASEQWTALCMKVPAGEFDPVTPIGALATRASAGVAETSVLMPAFSAGASDGGGRLVWAGIADDDPQTTLAAGYTSLSSVDRGVVSLSVQTRDTAVANSESLSGGTRAIATDSWCSIGFIVRKPADATPFNDARAAVRAGINFSGSDTHGGDAELSNMPVASITRTSDTVIRILFNDFSAYNITADESYTITLPASLTVAGVPINVTGTFNITYTPIPPSAILAGTAITGGILESEVKTAGVDTVQWVLSDVEFIGNS